MKYFLHDSNAFNDEKITALFIQFGYEGIGLFFTILEKLAMQEKPVKTDVLKKQLFVGKKLEKCWKFLEEIGLISSNNGETFNKQLLNFSENYKIKSEKNAKRISEWREKQQDTENVTRYESFRNTSKVNRSKENIIKEKENNNKSALPFEEGDFENSKKTELAEVAIDVKNQKKSKEKVAPVEIELPWPEEEFENIWNEWKNFRREKGKSEYVSRGEVSALSHLVTLSGGKLPTAILIIRQSMAYNWDGLFALKINNQQTYTNGKEPIADRAARIVRDFYTEQSQ